MNNQVVSVLPTSIPIKDPTKVCSKCKEEKPLSEFHIRKNSKCGFHAQCKKCSNLWNSMNLKKQYLKYKKHKIEYRKEHKDQIRKKVHQYYVNHLDKIKLENKKHYVKNKKYYSNYVNQWNKDKRRTDVNFKILSLCRSRIRDAIKNNWKSERTTTLIMCSIPELKQHIERQWLPGMSWSNWGKGEGTWQIDHIIPCNFFDLSDPVEQYMCFRYTNVQPLWWKDNQSKKDKIIYHDIMRSELC